MQKCPENQNKYQIIWDNTTNGTVANYFNYKGTKFDFSKEMELVPFGQTVDDVLEKLRKKLVGAARVGKNIIFNIDKEVPDFNKVYTSS